MPKPTSHTSPAPRDPRHAVKVLDVCAQWAAHMEGDLRKAGLQEEAHLLAAFRMSAEQRLSTLSGPDAPSS